MTEQNKTTPVNPALEELKTVFNISQLKFRRMDSPKDELRAICETLKEALATDRMGNEPDFAEFVHKELSIGLMQKLAKTISFDPEYLETVADTMEVFIDLFNKQMQLKRYNESFTCAMTWCFQPENNLFKKNFLITDDELKRLKTIRQKWRAELVVGDWIDVHINADDKQKIQGWAQAKIERVDNDLLSLVFPHLPVETDCDIDRWSTDIAQFEAKTAEDYAWRRENLAKLDLVDFLVDCHDKFKWEESTLFKTFEDNSGGRPVLYANTGFRVYRSEGKKLRSDERGVYDGWSSKYDEDIPVFNPRIQPHLSKVNSFNKEEDGEDSDEELDDLIQPEEGHSRVFVVPRLTQCICSKFLHMMNKFGNQGGFQAILDTLNMTPDENLTLTTMAYMITMISMPSKLFHKSWITEFGVPFTTSMRKQILGAPDNVLKTVSSNDVQQMQVSINSINLRILDRDATKREAEILKLEICTKCLSSTLLERRILGIKELNTIIRNNKTYGTKNFTMQQLIQWMGEMQVFSILWDPKKTHLQLVQRSNEIFKILPRENLLTMELLQQFWNLSKSDYKSEVFKIINEAAFDLQGEHINYLFDQITETPAAKLGMEEFDALSSLGKFAKDMNFQQKTSDFFWRIIVDSDLHKEELIENCINKFSDMIKYWTMEKKEPYFNLLTVQLQESKSSAVPIIRLFKKIIKDQKTKGTAYTSQNTYGTNPTGYVTTTATSTVVSYGTTTTADGKTIYSKSFGSINGGQNGQESIYPNAADEEDKQTSEDARDKEVTLRSVLNNLYTQENFVQALIGNLKAYCEAASQKIGQDPSLLNKDRSKMFPLSPKHSHQDELIERLSFLQEFAVNSDFQISKAQLKVIYDLMIKSPVKSDFTEFLTWCNTACQAQTAVTTVLDLEEVGEFFSELINTKSLNLEALPVVGFEFLKMYFTSQNQEQNKLRKVALPEKKKPVTSSWSGGFYSSSMKKEDEVEACDDDPIFKVTVDPSELTKIDMIWEIALQSRVEDVIKKSISFLVNCYLSVHDDLEDRRNEILQSINTRCFELIAANQANPTLIKRLVLILQQVIQLSERKGTGGVQPHNAILKGEILDRIIIRYMVKNKQSYYGTLKLDRSIVVKLYTSATVWDFKKEVSQMLGLSPKYIKLTLPGPDKEVIRDSQHGMTIEQLKLKNGDILTAEKLSIHEEITEAPIIDRPNRCLTARAAEIFTEWFDLYKNPQTGLMDAEHVARFIAGATKQTCLKEDQRVDQILSKYDINKDGSIDLSDFLRFYYEAANGTSLKAVQSNLKNHNVRLDLKKMSEVIEEVSFDLNEMPRYTLSANQSQFDALFNLLDRNDETSQDVWNLVRMLATNQKMYSEVLSLSQASQADGMINWESVFEDASLYKQIYKQEIIVAVMEASNTGNSKRVMFVEEQKIAANYPSQTNNAGGQSGKAAETQIDERESQNDQTQQTTASETQDADQQRLDQLKQNWTQQFLEQRGFNYIMASFLGKQVTVADTKSLSEQASLKDVGFLLTLLRVFLQAGFNTQQGSIGQAISLVRKSSSIRDDNDLNQKKIPEQDNLGVLMSSPEGQSIILETDFEQLFNKVLSLLAIILSKTTLIVEDKIIIENSLSIMVGILLFKKDIYSQFESFSNVGHQIKNAEELILAGILCPEEKVRIDFERSLHILATNLHGNETNCLNFLLGLLARNFANISNRPSMQFFELFNKLIDMKARRDFLSGDLADDMTAIYDPEDLLNQIIDKIKQQQKAKKEAAANDGVDEVRELELAAEQERLLVGLVTLTGKIIAKADKAVSDRIVVEKDLIGQIFKEFLFSSYYQAQQANLDSQDILIVQEVGSRNDKKKAAAPNNKSREAAYELLHQLIKNSTNLMKGFLETQLLPLIQTIKKPKTWSYQPQSTQERYQKYVGLRNLGCICYMNSMMQQFFMIPALRYNLLCIDDGKPENFVEYKGEKIDDNMMHQMQKLVAHLELSERNEFNPMAFCFSFKEFDGQPTNTSEQKDAQEFLNVIFDRLENQLKPTSRKHLVNGIFGGKQCNQMVCTECGKVKNRLEDYLNLSLPVKGVKSIEESLQKQVEGEIINDYQCDGCGRKVDLSKRTLITTTPNVLIVHLQRICFNFDTFQNDKINSFCSFPNVLDLKPYSFHEVMRKEGRLKEQQDEDENSQQVDEKNMTEEEIQKRREAEAEAQEPECDDCFEYKLVGVNVHSGTANAGHYWSYINTNRGTDEKDGDPNWIRTEADPWMEFNDSRVSDWEFKELKQRTFGNEAKSNQNAYFSSMGDSYGTSAYMLFYERRKKKDLVIIVPEDKVEDQRSKGVNVLFNEEKKEHFKMEGYRTASVGETANEIYKKVFEDNMKFTFESDIYSAEFFDFILSILNSVAETEVDDMTKINGLKIGSKVGFEILARMFTNPGIDRVSSVLINILKSRPEITKPFMASLLENSASSAIWEVLLDCSDKNAQKVLGRVINYALCQLKLQEKESALANETETIKVQFEDTDGILHISQVNRPKSICIRFIHQMVQLLPERAAKNWRKFDSFLDIFYAFMVNSCEEIELESDKYDSESEAYKVGIEIFFVNDMIRHLGDFILQENSPYHEIGQVRVNMGGTYGSPNFSAILKLIIIMISDRALLAKYPLNEKDQAIVAHKDILQKMIEPGEGSNADFSGVLTGMAYENIKISKKMAQAYLKGLNKTGIEPIILSLKQIRHFLKINDSLKKLRLEWIMGIPQVISKQNFRNRQQQYGLELVELISDEYIQFKSCCVKGITDAFLGQLFKAKGRMETQCIIGLRYLIEMCLEDEEVAKFVYQSPSPSMQYARYTDWFFLYAEQLKESTNNQIKNSQTTLQEYHRNRLDSLDFILSMQEKLESIFAPWKEDQKAKLEKLGESGQFLNFAEQTLVNVVDDVIPCYPPTYIVGPTTNDYGETIYETDTEFATISLVEVSCEYIYSNPNGLFNLSVPDKMWRNPLNYTQVSYKSWKVGELRKAQTPENQIPITDEDIVIKNWKTDCSRGPTILKVMIKSKAQKMIRVGIKLSVADNENKNVIFPETQMKENLFANDFKQAFVFLKVDPSKETWGDIQCEVFVKPGNTTQISTSTGGYGSSGNYGNGSTYSTNMGYGNVMTTQTTTTSYTPKGVDSSDTTVTCVNCSADCFYGETFCGKCGKSVTDIEETYNYQ